MIKYPANDPTRPNVEFWRPVTVKSGNPTINMTTPSALFGVVQSKPNTYSVYNVVPDKVEFLLNKIYEALKVKGKKKEMSGDTPGVRVGDNSNQNPRPSGGSNGGGAGGGPPPPPNYPKLPQPPSQQVVTEITNHNTIVNQYPVNVPLNLVVNPTPIQVMPTPLTIMPTPVHIDTVGLNNHLIQLQQTMDEKFNQTFNGIHMYMQMLHAHQQQMAAQMDANHATSVYGIEHLHNQQQTIMGQNEQLQIENSNRLQIAQNDSTALESYKKDAANMELLEKVDSLEKTLTDYVYQIAPMFNHLGMDTTALFTALTAKDFDKVKTTLNSMFKEAVANNRATHKKDTEFAITSNQLGKVNMRVPLSIEPVAGSSRIEPAEMKKLKMVVKKKVDDAHVGGVGKKMVLKKK